MNRILIVLLIAIVALGYWLAPRLLPYGATADILTVPKACDFSSAVCEMMLPGGVALSIEVQGDVRPLKTFSIAVKGTDVQDVAVSFEMIDMDMGINRYRFQKDVSGGWSTAVMLPVCTTGRTDWLALFDVRLQDGQVYRLEYPFMAEGNTLPAN